MSAFEVGTSDTPVYRDGLTSDLSYVFLACKVSDTYNGVVYGHNGKLKFYPNAEFWGMNQGILNDLGIGSLYNRSNYQGVQHVSADRIPALLERLRTQRGVHAVSDKDFNTFGKVDRGSARGRSRDHHPATHGVPSAEALQSLATVE